MSRPSLPPQFAPGSGWYQPGQYSPQSMMAKQEMLKAAFPCTLVVLRRRGVRIPAIELARNEPPTGFLLCDRTYTHPHWAASFYADAGMAKELQPKLLCARLVREHLGTRLYQGMQWENRMEYPQSWLCAPTPARALEIVLDMLEQDRGTL